MVSQKKSEIAEVEWISHGDLIKLHASAAARALGLSTSEFLTLWEAGGLDEQIDRSDHPDVFRWNMLMSFGGPNTTRSA